MECPARRGRRRGALLGVALLAAPALAACGAQDSGPPTINLYHAPEQNLQTVVDDCNREAAGRYRIVYHKLPRDADGQREQLVRRLAARDTELDVLGLDTTWTAEFAEAGWIREWTGETKAAAARDVLPGPLESARWHGKVYAVTKNTNVQLLWYRSDLVDQPPRTWSEMIQVAQRLAEQGKPSAILITGAQYEGLVVNYNNLVASAGGRIVSEDGTRAVVDDGAVRALRVLKDFATSGVTNPALENHKEDGVRLAFQAGDGAFQINWPFVHPATKAGNPDVFRNMKWARLPGVDPGQPGRATIGGANYAISSYSRHPGEAFEAALCLRNPEHQKFSAVKDGVPPTIESVYDEPEIAEAYPMKETIREELKDAALRPVTPAYQNVSTVLSTLLSPPSAIDPERTAARMRTELQDALESKGVLP
ncbi:sugar ABC transporter substrate-binding protein [Longimycelium tulufanense]|uniref:Sugar ABC transporter substrate-binding protein n=1 Tax=Longimycelium tulufanense TaxID=907463 RepID=A0A8J3C6P8_9PSEU|nr:ABC transporter substrate-binding protein [Longimycelium tulufanense]GGM42668.1 sugar ABC transporter substrate-binding protein [Longimycelium tulufanense]